MNENFSRISHEFYRDFYSRGNRESTAKGYLRALNRFEEYLEEKELGLTEVGLKEAQAFQGWLIEQGKGGGERYADGSIGHFIKAVTNLYNYLKTKGMMLENPFSYIKKLSVEKKIPRNIPKEKEMNLFLEKLACFDEEKSINKLRLRYRTHVVAELQYSTAMRIEEVSKLKEEDIELDKGIVHVMEGKGGVSRVVFLNAYAKEILKIYLGELRALLFIPCNHRELFFGVGSSRLTNGTNEVLKEVAGLMGLPPMSSHVFRHAVGYHFLRAGCDIRHIQEILGHKRIRSTEIYTKVEKEELKAALDRYHPRKLSRR